MYYPVTSVTMDGSQLMGGLIQDVSSVLIVCPPLAMVQQLVINVILITIVLVEVLHVLYALKDIVLMD